MIKLIIFVVLIAVVFVVLKKYFPDIFNEKEKVSKSPYNYKKKDFLMSRAEHEFFDILVEVIGNQYYVFPQIHLSTILDNKVVGQNWRGAFRHIDEKSVDFVVCDKAYIKPILAIELDDRTHEREDRKGRDGEVERILNESELALLRFGNNGSFNKEEIKRLILEKLR
jgi:very-short-patch-repair endonuclease